jgi:peptidoglycan/xylan/chitin deacetylase (PgdA/CDA1 family)
VLKPKTAQKNVFLAAFLFAALDLGAGIRFSGLNLSGDRLLLGASAFDSGTQLFLGGLGAGTVKQLSASPEKLTVLSGGATILVQSPFGLQSLSGGLPETVPGFPPFTGAFAVSGGADTIAPSADGKWALFVEPASYGRGDLVLLDVKSGARRVISAGIERPGKFFPASWSADSQLFIYEKTGKLYFYTVNTPTPPPSDENFRYVGEGGISSVRWTSGGFYYLKESVLYLVRTAEVIGKSVYTSFLEIGSVAASLPFSFDPNFDVFETAPDRSGLIFVKNRRTVFYYPLGNERPSQPLPYIPATWPFNGVTVLWGADSATVLFGSGTEVAAYRIETGAESFQKLAAPNGRAAALSPDGKKLLVWGGAGAFLYDYAKWTLEKTLSRHPVLTCAWINADECVVGGERLVDKVTLSTWQAELIALSAVDEYGFNRADGRIMARAGEAWYATDGVTLWRQVQAAPMTDPVEASPLYRVYLDSQKNGFFENMIMVRNLSGSGAYPLFPVIGLTRSGFGSHGFGGAPPPVSELPGVFNHGSRESRKIALCFDVYDDDTGLYPVLETLQRYGVKATFFVNGEFIRRHPEGAAVIAAGGHEGASLFFTQMDLSDARYRVDREFIQKGLARNEDEYYKASAGELALLWHPPWYAVSPEIAAAAAAAGYRTVGRDIDPGDWINRDDLRRLGLDQAAAADMIDAVMDAVQGGSIIPIRLGKLSGGRADYLFNSLELLLDALLRSGYEPGPVSLLGDS